MEEVTHMYGEDETIYGEEQTSADIKSSEQVENDEITPGEEGFMQGYEDADEDESVNNPYAEEEEE
jgi:hypothetical protein